MYRTSLVIIENKPLQGEARPLLRDGVWAYFPDNDRRSIHYSLHKDWFKVLLSASMY